MVALVYLLDTHLQMALILQVEELGVSAVFPYLETLGVDTDRMRQVCACSV